MAFISIPKYAFSDCKNLKKAVIEKRCRKLKYAFEYNGANQRKIY